MRSEPRRHPLAGAPGEDRGDRNERKLIPLMAVPPPDRKNEHDHRGEPPMEDPGVFSARRNERADNGKREKHRCETRAHGLLRDFPIPRGVHDPKTAAAEKVIRIKSFRDPMRVPIPDRGRHERDQGEKPKFPTRKKALKMRRRSPDRRHLKSRRKPQRYSQIEQRHTNHGGRQFDQECNRNQNCGGDQRTPIVLLDPHEKKYMPASARHNDGTSGMNARLATMLSGANA